MINLLGAALIGLSSPVSPHAVATLGVWPTSAVVVVVQDAVPSGGGGDKGHRRVGQKYFALPDHDRKLPASARIVILTAAALVEILQ